MPGQLVAPRLQLFGAGLDRLAFGLQALEGQLDLPEITARRPARHQTMRATLDWSYSLIGDAERAVLRRLARQLGGDITVQSSAGAGSRFRVTIPPASGASGASTAGRRWRWVR